MIQGVFFVTVAPQSIEKLTLAMLGISRTIYVDVESPNLGFPYYNFLWERQSQKTPYIYCLHPFCNWLSKSWPLTCSLFIDIALNNMFLRTLFLISHVSKKISISRFERHCNFITKFFPYMKLLFVGRCCCYGSHQFEKQNFATYQSKPAFYKRQHQENSGFLFQRQWCLHF